LTDQQQETGPDTEAPPSITTGLSRLLEIIWAKVQRRDEVADWFSQWVPLMESLQSLVMTLGSVAMAVRARAGKRDEPYLDTEELEQLKAELVEVFEASPNAAELIFGLENIDVAIQEIVEDEESRDAAARIFAGLEARLDGVIQRLITWVTDEGEPPVTIEQLQTFLEQIERVLQEAIDRWLLPTIMDSELKRGDK
jgi:hypothetical protein